MRSSAIELSDKVLTGPDRLRCTLIHEMCHAATWIYNGENGHGKTWKAWLVLNVYNLISIYNKKKNIPGPPNQMQYFQSFLKSVFVMSTILSTNTHTSVFSAMQNRMLTLVRKKLKRFVVVFVMVQLKYF